MRKDQQLRQALLAAAAAVCVAALLLVVYFFGAGRRSGGSITLPQDGAAETPERPQDPQTAAQFLTVDRETILPLLRSLSRPACYYQALTATLYWDQSEAAKTVEVYRLGQVIKGIVRQGTETKYLLTDGQTLYVWYEGDGTAFSTRLSSDTALDDLLGIPTYETVLQLPEDAVVEAGYVEMGETETCPCVYLACQVSEDGYTDRYWIDVESQMLYRADAQFADQQIYLVQQTAFTACTPGPETADWTFSLPDGTEPFLEALSAGQ